jgi:UDP-glucose 4-epimerase
LVTGAARELGADVVRRLDREPSVTEVLGLDFERPPGRFRKLRLIRGDVRQPAVSARVREAAPDVVVHCALHVAGGSMRAAHEWNVIGTMNLLAGCQDVRKLVLRSSGLVYPIGLDMPSLLREDDAGRRPPAAPLGRDFYEVEALVSDFAAAHPAALTTVLRLGQLLGARWRSLLSDYLAIPTPPALPGFDPRLQLLAEDDAVEAVVRAVTADHPGVYNVAGDGVLLLSQLLSITGRQRRAVLPLAGGPWIQRQVARALVGADVPADLIAILTWGCVLDGDRLYHEFGWRPPHSGRDAAEQYAASRSPLVLTA